MLVLMETWSRPPAAVGWKPFPKPLSICEPCGGGPLLENISLVFKRLSSPLARQETCLSGKQVQMGSKKDQGCLERWPLILGAMPYSSVCHWMLRCKKGKKNTEIMSTHLVIVCPGVITWQCTVQPLDPCPVAVGGLWDLGCMFIPGLPATSLCPARLPSPLLASPDGHSLPRHSCPSLLITVSF